MNNAEEVGNYLFSEIEKIIEVKKCSRKRIDDRL